MHRRDAPLDRGDRGRGDGAAGRAPPAAGVRERWRSGLPRSRWCSPRKARRGARMLEAAGIPVEMRAGRYRRARDRSARRPRDRRRRSRRCWRARRRSAVAARMPGRLVLGADQTLALGDAAVLQAGRSRGGARAACSALRGQTHELHSAVAVVRDGAVAVRACRRRAADACGRSPTPFSSAISTPPATR